MDGSTLVRLLSDDAPDEAQNRLKDLHSQYYEEAVSLLRPLPAARTLLQRVATLGLQVVLATSAPEHELASLRTVLDCEIHRSPAQNLLQ
jgi:phosphoglycolate phosphatase-like HAD superfamily hydrolase